MEDFQLVQNIFDRFFRKGKGKSEKKIEPLYYDNHIRKALQNALDNGKTEYESLEVFIKSIGYTWQKYPHFEDCSDEDIRVVKLSFDEYVAMGRPKKLALIDKIQSKS